jgi:ssRNA-specific RNase YbeY (16S rRNA maturation enzyme)
MSIEINNESGVAVDEAALAMLGRFVLDALSVDRLAELSLVLLDADAMAALHAQWMFELQAQLLADWSAQTGREKVRAPLAGTGGEVRDVPGK